mmetsp:Transcript_3268/g.6528  ORF Transcript_3268/g.6528 Transcript_3268/m.6528 type:complete len:384 (+) Transcript_3268:97-1248(+)
MHSVFALKKKEREEQHVASIRARIMSEDPASHSRKTKKLANRYEVRVDSWMKDGEGKERIASDKNTVFYHKFRDRSPTCELGNPSISPRRYATEAQRIADALAATHSDREQYTGKPIALFRARDKAREIHADSTMRFRPRKQKDRIEEYIAGNLVAVKDPWTRYDHPSHKKSRDVERNKWVGGEGVDFDLSVSLKEEWPHNFVAASAPYALAFGAKPDDFRERNPQMEHSGEFLNNVPGYFPDDTPGKWQMDFELGRPVRQDLSRRRSPPTSPASTNYAADGHFAGGSEVMNMSSSTKRIRGGRVVSPKNYWKASTQISVQKKEAVDRYHGIPDRPFEQHQERASTATSLLHEHLNLKDTIARKLAVAEDKRTSVADVAVING